MKRLLLLALPLSVMGCRDIHRDEHICMVWSQSEVQLAATDEYCRKIHIEGDELTNLDGLAGLNHPADVVLGALPRLIRVVDLPPIEGRLGVSALALTELVASTTDGLAVSSSGQPDVALTLFGSSTNREVLVNANLSSLEVGCEAATCDVAVSFHYLFDGELSSSFGENIRLKIEFIGNTIGLDSLKSLPIEQIDELSFESMPDRKYDDLREFRQFLIDEGYAGPVKFPYDLLY